MVRALACFGLLLLLAGCGGPPRFFSVDEMDEAGLRSAGSFSATEPEWEYQRPSNWEISNKDWDEMHRVSSTAYHRELQSNRGRHFFTMGKGSKADSGAMVDMKITRIDRGHYTFFTYSPAVLDGTLTITDAKSGKVLFKGRGVAKTPGRGGWEKAGDGGRIEGAHILLAEEILDLVNYYDGKK